MIVKPGAGGMLWLWAQVADGSRGPGPPGVNSADGEGRRVHDVVDGGTLVAGPGDNDLGAADRDGMGEVVGLPVAGGAPHLRPVGGAFGGWLAAEPVAGRGFRVTAEVPVEGTTR
jgi:hypothetical protein